jgi:uncharacterized protein YkwD
MKKGFSYKIFHILPLGLIAFLVFLNITHQPPASADCTEKTGYGYNTCAAGVTFNDSVSHRYEEAVKYAQRNRIVKGYEDGTFKPNNPLNRAEFTKILVESVLSETPSAPTSSCFPDVPSGIWFEKYVCHGKDKLFNGYPDGSFQPGNNINVAEAAKIISNAFELNTPEEVEGEMWFGRYLAALEEKKALPGTFKSSFHLVTRGEMVEMIMLLNEKISSKPSLSACDFIPERCLSDVGFSGYGDNFAPKGIDMKKVRLTWLAWYNLDRRKEGLHDYSFNNQLNRSAYIWSEFSHQRGEISHKRIGQTEYYDYSMINQWFADLGLQFENIYRVTHSENIGGGGFSCSDSDCTDELIASIRGTFDFYMSEKDKEYKPHYNSVMNGYFNEIGLGISIDEATNKYYLTVHYGTKLI